MIEFVLSGGANRGALQVGALVHHINIRNFSDLDLFDFSKTAQLIAAGRAAVETYLSAPRPNTVEPLTPASTQTLPARPLPRGGRPFRE